MKRFFGIMLPLAFLLSSCAESEDVYTTQQSTIVQYLTSTRRLISADEVGDVIEDNPAFYTVHGRSAYRYIPTYYDEGRDERAEVVWGSTVEIMFDAYVFSGSEPSTSNIYWSNIPETISDLGSDSVNPNAQLAWSTDPLVVKLGETKVIEGIEQALPGCRDQDSVQVYMTYNMAYGDRLVGTVPKKSSVAWYMKILSVN